MEIQTRTEGDICIATVQDTRIDAPAAVAFKEAMRQKTQDAPHIVVLDLSRVGFIDSSGLGALVATLKLLSPARELRLAGLTPAVQKVLTLTRMDKVFAIFLTLEEALDAQRV